ncbi:hypothetical protein J3459_014262 [Metarhizium acridum]|uniref:uncharacterized protein n=1 Tax=Metarhizium acridum TaxID=92637 RepID=UPI001C6C510C|nr:hypothetical protein J3459_014262 [Metarhizium acridum]KAG8416326.1 hypothetical protein J3458_006918 [Metarhizium acridum]
MVAYTTQINLRTFAGITRPTGYESTAVDSIPTQPDLQALEKTDGDEIWEESKVPKPLTKMMSSLNNWRFFVSRKGPLTPGVMDVWLCLSSGELITQATMPYVVDSFPYNLHLFPISPELRAMIPGCRRDKGDRRPSGRPSDKEQGPGRHVVFDGGDESGKQDGFAQAGCQVAQYAHHLEANQQ